MSILFCKFLQENMVYRKNGVHHDKANGKSFETVTSFFLFLKLCHRDFSPQSNVKNHNFINRKVYQLFDKFMIFNITLWRKISVTKFQKSKIWSDSLEGFSVADVVVYLIFSVNIIFMEKFAKQNDAKWMLITKSVHFVLQISPRKHGLQKKWSTPRRCQRKILRNCHLNFFIFETLSQRFFVTK